MKPKPLLLLVLSAIFMTIGLVSIGYTLYKIDQIVVYEAKIGVSQKGDIGIAVDTDTFNMGIVPAGGKTTRKLAIQNIMDQQRQIEVLVEGDLASFIEKPKQIFTLQPKEKLLVDIVAIIPKDATVGNYTGKVSVLVKK
ncbi:hypothetical protein HYS48_02320 [Candidatus Woesearchaeota archaeon]|nr:hypothetical protein [Candidatus Woesearchaeota archaeon]